MKAPLGLDEETWLRRNRVARETYGRHKSWQKGYKAGRKGMAASDNPYTLTADIWKLLRRRAYWEMGREEGAFQPPKHKHRKETKKDQMRRLEKEFKKNKHGKHHRKHE